MKRYLTFLTAVLLLFVLSSVSCEAASLKNRIIGKWIEVNGSERIEFLKDGTFILGSSAGDYKLIADNRLRIDIKGGRARVLEVSFDKEGALILKDPTGGVSKYLTEKAYKAYRAKLEALKKAEVEAERKAKEERKKTEIENFKKGEGMVYVKGGCYQMGDTFGDGYSDEKPVHEVCVDDFYIGKYEVTQGQWEAIMGNNPSRYKDCGDNCPVEQVSWNDIQDFITKLNQKTTPSVPLNKGGIKGGYRLPTEAEWEYAARSGEKNEKYAGTSNESELPDYAWYSKNSGGRTHPVGQKKPNGLGIYDMSGNVYEWVSDWFGIYENSPKNNPTGPNSGSLRVRRGGSWDHDAWLTRTAYRLGYHPNNWSSDFGFRVARTP